LHIICTNICYNLLSFVIIYCDNAHLPGLRSCEDAGSDNGPSGNEGYIGELYNSCVGTASCLGIGSDGGFIGKVTSSCNSASQACAGAGGAASLFGSSYGGGGIIGEINNSCNENDSCKFLGSKDGFVGIVTNSCGGGTKACYMAAYDGGAIQEIYNSCNNAERACDGLTNAAQPETRQRMLARKKTKAPKPANPNKPPAPAPKPANPNKPEPNTPNPNKPTPPPAPPVETPAPGPTLPPVPDGALCLESCCNAEVVEVCGGINNQTALYTKGGCPTECSGSITPWGA